MKVSRRTRQILAEAKAEASEQKLALEFLKIRILEHPGMKREARKLERVINQLDEWQRVA